MAPEIQHRSPVRYEPTCGGRNDPTQNSEVPMTRARSVLLIVFLLAGSLSPPFLEAQSAEASTRSPPGESQGFALGQNYPDPVSPETWIPFRLTPSLFETRSEVVVTIRIVNSLNQVVAIPEASDHPAGRGIRIINLSYSEPGLKDAYWDGKDAAGRQVPSGVYYVQMVVLGEAEPQTRKILVDNPQRRRWILPW